MMEHFYFGEKKDRNDFFLNCLEKGIHAKIDHKYEYMVIVDTEKTLAQKNGGYDAETEE